jgi:diaminohydroxyphosphoribosylaminopyrimidine deaminase/5-amino-6-(5-phosphoribosylamino)uracil reductase
MFNLALKLAAAGRNHAPPNPCIGCVIVSDDGLLLGLGHSQHAGGNHAEIMALRDAHSRMNKVEGATAYVTLEPCSHHGRTGPCCDALIDAKIARVIATQADPNPLVAGQGFARLRAAGIAVEVLTPDHPVAVQARELNIGFFSRMVRKRPWVRMKVAQSLDGKTALNNGASQWITSPEARADGHAWRARACAILTGSGTVLSDRPRLDVRLVETSRQPHVVIVDSSLQTPPESALFIQGRKVFIYCAQADPDRRRALEEAVRWSLNFLKEALTTLQPPVWTLAQ